MPSFTYEINFMTPQTEYFIIKYLPIAGKYYSESWISYNDTKNIPVLYESVNKALRAAKSKLPQQHLDGFIKITKIKMIELEETMY